MKPRTMLVAVVAVLIGAFAGAGALVALDDDDATGIPPMHTGAPMGDVGRMTRMEQSGEMHDVAERHRQMLEQMQTNASPQMLDLMNNDPMWQMMRSGEWARLDEEHQEDIDRMLGRGQP